MYTNNVYMITNLFTCNHYLYSSIQMRTLVDL